MTAATRTESNPTQAGVARVRRLVPTIGWLLVWIYLYMIVLLGGWVLLSGLAGGWEPVVITSGSTHPSIRVGDVLMIDEHPDELMSEQAVVLTLREDDRVAHRILGVENGEYVIASDTSPTPGTDRLLPDDVRGVGRLVVPAIGLPIVWARDGSIIPLTAWVLVTLTTAAVAVAGVARRRRGRARVDRPTNAMSQAGVRRLRGLVAVMIGAQWIVDSEQFRIDNSTVSTWAMPVLTILLLGLVNHLTSGDPEDSRASRRSARLALSADTAVVVALAMTTGTSGVAWILFALPVIEAAIGFGIAGALTHWLALTSLTLVTRVWISAISGSTSSETIAELDQLVDQLSILFLIVIPSAYLADQLLLDVRSQARATMAAENRSTLLETVVEAGHEVNRLGGQNVEALLDAAIGLGFETADVVVLEVGGASTIMASRSPAGLRLPEPGEWASGVRREDLIHRTVIVDGDDPSRGETRGLSAAGLAGVVATLVTHVGKRRVVLRVGTERPEVLSVNRLDALSLLASQAGIALTNDQLVGELRGMRDEMTHQARHDSLTGLANRFALRLALSNALEDCEPGREPAVLFLDLNVFKPVNDRLGHDAGDELLQQLAERLRGLVTHPDLVSRLGGDEFVIMLHHDAGGRISSMIASVQAEIDKPFELTAGKVSVGVAIGYAVGSPDVTSSELLRQADVAMYEAKRNNVGSIRYERELDAPRRRRNALAADVEQALHARQLQLLYQPIVHVDSERIVGLEALVRWEHHVHGPVPPPVLIDAARDAGLGEEVSRWIADTVVDQTKAWGFGETSSLFMTINASAEELEHPWLATNILEAIDRNDLPTTAVWVELSERLVSDPLPTTTDNLAALRYRGVQLLLDDFGEGRTSLGHLSRLPIGGVKLGREFVVSCLESESDRIVLESVIELSTRLGFVVVAEGIETDKQVRAVTAAGCRLLQGYFLHRPLTAQQVSTLLEVQSRTDAQRDAEVH